MILVGVGSLGSALLRYGGFAKEGFEITAAFDVAPVSSRAAGTKVEIMDVSEMRKFVHEKRVRMAILTVPVTVAQEVTNQLVEAGVIGILNFSPIFLQVPDGVVVNNVDLALELENLSYFIQ